MPTPDPVEPPPVEPPPAEDPPLPDLAETVVVPDVRLGVDGRSERVQFDVPGGLRSVTISTEGRFDARYIIDRVVDGAGQVWVDRAPDGVVIDALDIATLPFPGPFLSPNRVIWGEGVATAMLPGHPGVEPAPGRWTVQVAADPPADGELVDVVAQIERGPTPPTGRLDVHFFFTGSTHWTAGNAAGDEDFRRLLNVVTVLMRGAGIALGAVTYNDIELPEPNISARLDLPLILRRSPYSTGVSVFFVDRIEDDMGAPIAGIAGGVPGSLGLSGTGANGVAVAARFAVDPRVLGLTVAHELGHALGLFHTVEAEPRYGDQLDDTAVGEAGRDNVMYPTAGPELRRFSPQQGRVMRSSRGVEVDDSER